MKINGFKGTKIAESVKKAGFHSIAATIRTRRESRCLLYKSFLLLALHILCEFLCNIINFIRKISNF